MGELVIGIDLGTQSCKAVVCGGDLAVMGAGRVTYGVDFPAPGRAEQDPARWLEALAPAIAQALAAAGRGPDDVAAIAVAGQLDGMVAVDAGGAALGPCLIWLDRRAVDELPVIVERGDAAGSAAAGIDHDQLLAVTGQVADPSHLAAKARWWDRHGAARAAGFHLPVSFVVAALTGARVIDPAHASTTLLFDLAAGAWSPALLAAFELDAARLPAIAPAHAIAGGLTAAGARLTGLPIGLPVAVGTGDDFATPLGVGLRTRELIACIGTAEVVGARADAPVRDRGRLVETHAYPAGGWFVENPGWLSGGAVAWLGGLLGLDAAGFDAAAAAAPPGAGGVGFLPALGGAMTPVWDPAARGAFAGLAPGHGAPHLCRALYEGCAFAMRDVAERIASLAIAVDRLVIAGGGARSRTWAQIRADVTGLPAAIAADPDTCPIGAALLAAVAAGLHRDVAAAAAALPPPAETLDPDPAQRDVHDRGHARYRGLAAALIGLH